MLNTPVGNRTLSDAEATLFRVGGAVIVKLLRLSTDSDGQSVITGVDVFDQLQLSQQIALIDRVSRCLLTDDLYESDTYSEFDAAIMVVYEMLRSKVEEEIGDNDHPRYDSCLLRSLIVEVLRETPANESMSFDSSELLDPRNASAEQWAPLIGALADRVLWDRDFEMMDIFADAEPEIVEAQKEMLGIKTGYFSTAAPEVLEDQQLEVLYSLMQLFYR